MNNTNNINEKNIKMQCEIVNFYNNVLTLLSNNKKIHKENQENDNKIKTTFEIKKDKKNNQIKAIYKKEKYNENIRIPNKKIFLIIMKIEITNDTNKIEEAILKEEADNDNYIIVRNLSINTKYIYNNIKEMNSYDNLKELLNNKKAYQIICNANKELSKYNNNEKTYIKKN